MSSAKVIGINMLAAKRHAKLAETGAPLSSVIAAPDFDELEGPAGGLLVTAGGTRRRLIGGNLLAYSAAQAHIAALRMYE